ncbi:hypothetical protein CHUAL_002720 [Chamberlinius hualienensis]
MAPPHMGSPAMGGIGPPMSNGMPGYQAQCWGPPQGYPQSPYGASYPGWPSHPYPVYSGAQYGTPTAYPGYGYGYSWQQGPPGANTAPVTASGDEAVSETAPNQSTTSIQSSSSTTNSQSGLGDYSQDSASYGPNRTYSAGTDGASQQTNNYSTGNASTTSNGSNGRQQGYHPYRR